MKKICLVIDYIWIVACFSYVNVIIKSFGRPNFFTREKNCILSSINKTLHTDRKLTDLSERSTLSTFLYNFTISYKFFKLPIYLLKWLTARKPGRLGPDSIPRSSHYAFRSTKIHVDKKLPNQPPVAMKARQADVWKRSAHFLSVKTRVTLSCSTFLDYLLWVISPRYLDEGSTNTAINFSSTFLFSL